jgi:hypothetical protein
MIFPLLYVTFVVQRAASECVKGDAGPTPAGAVNEKRKGKKERKKERKNE